MPRRHLRVEEVSQTIILLREGYSQREVAQILNTNKSVVQRAAARHRTTGSLKRKRGQGAKRKTTAREDHYIELQALRKRFVTSRELKNDLRLATGKEISTKTVRRRLKEVNLIARKPATGPILTALHKINRLSFCLNHQFYSLMSPDFTFPITIVVFSFCEDLVKDTHSVTFVELINLVEDL
jgi:transposase